MCIPHQSDKHSSISCPAKDSKRLCGSSNSSCLILSAAPIAVAQYLQMRFSSVTISNVTISNVTISKGFLQFLRKKQRQKNCFTYLKIRVSGRT